MAENESEAISSVSRSDRKVDVIGGVIVAAALLSALLFYLS